MPERQRGFFDIDHVAVAEQRLAQLHDNRDKLFAQLLLAGGWRPMDEYKPTKAYVYLRGEGPWGECVSVARRGWHPYSYWYAPPPGGAIAISAWGWLPIPDDRDPFVDDHLMYGDPDAGKFVRPPEPVFEAGGVDTRLTPVPLQLLKAIQDGAVLKERAWQWTEWKLHRPDGTVEKLGERGINRLRQVAFIERVGTLPPGRIPRWVGFDWRITAAGHAWLAARD